MKIVFSADDIQFKEVRTIIDSLSDVATKMKARLKLSTIYCLFYIYQLKYVQI